MPVAPRSVVNGLGLVVTLAGSLMLSACGAADPTGSPTVASVLVTPATATLVSLAETVQLTAGARDASGNTISGKTFMWASSDDNVATVSSTGLVTAISNGAATITAATDGITGRASVIVSQTVNRVLVTPQTTTLRSLGDTVHLTASARDALGNAMPNETITWSAVGGVQVDPTGLVTAVANGTATVTARTDSAAGTARIVVDQVATEMVFSVQPSEALLMVRMWPEVEVTLLDARGNRVTDGTKPVTLTLETNPTRSTLLGTTTVAAVNGVATFRDVALDNTGAGYVLEASAAGLPNETSSSFDVFAFQSISAGGHHTCALATSGTAYCWGFNNGKLGDGWVVTRTLPVKVSGGYTFTSISASGTNSHTCGVTTSGSAYCWGSNHAGQLGDGTTNGSDIPVQVSGGLTFASVSAGGNHGQPANSHTCGVTIAGIAYCWGYNLADQLGDGTHTASPTPVAVTGGHTFTSLSAGGYHNCGMSSGNIARCWGGSFDGDTMHDFTQVEAGTFHNCGVRSNGTAYCWGNNQYGQLGIGGTGTSGAGDVTGGLTFASVSTGGIHDGHHSCGVTTSGDMYCWGSNRFGQLGAATGSGTSDPVAVSGGHTFVSASAGGQHSCGITTSGVAYCWGYNIHGQLGDGTTSDRSAPVRVGGH